MAKLSTYAAFANATDVAAGDLFAMTDLTGPATKNLAASNVLQAALLLSTGFGKLASNVLSFGPNGATNPVLTVDGSTASAATGVEITGAAAAAGVDITVTSSGANESLTFNAKGTGELSFNPTATGDIVLNRLTRFPDAIDAAFGTGEDALIRWSTADADNHSLVVALDNTNQSLHVTDKGAVATDWNIAATTDPNVYIHSNTTPATDYLRVGGHTGTAADIDVVGGTTLNLKIGGTSSLSVISTNVFIGDTAHGAMTQGLCVNQNASDDLILALKSSDVATGLTTAPTGTVETDDFFTVAKFAATTGGAVVQALGENAAVTSNFVLESYGGQADTTKTASARGLVEVYAAQHNGSNALADVGADGNVFAVRGRRGSADVALFVVDEDGEIHSDVTLNVFDEHDDMALVRSFDYVGERKGLVKMKWDEYARVNEDSLVRLGILGAPIAEGGLVNHNRLVQLHNGAISQMYEDVLGIAALLPPEKRAMLPERIRNRLALTE